MTDEKQPNEAPMIDDEENQEWTFTRAVIFGTTLFIGLVALFFVFALILALTNPEGAGGIIEVIRDVVITVLALQVIFIIGAVAILLIQLARFINLLLNETKPILQNTQEATRTVKTSAEFVGKNAVGPIIRAQAFLAGLWIFISELTKINRLIKRRPKGPADGQ